MQKQGVCVLCDFSQAPYLCVVLCLRIISLWNSKAMKLLKRNLFVFIRPMSIRHFDFQSAKCLARLLLWRFWTAFDKLLGSSSLPPVIICQLVLKGIVDMWQSKSRMWCFGNAADSLRLSLLHICISEVTCVDLSTYLVTNVCGKKHDSSSDILCFVRRKSGVKYFNSVN